MMKKLYLMTIAVMLIGFTYAQQHSKRHANSVNQIKKSVQKQTILETQERSTEVVFFSEDFESGTAGSWTTTDVDGDGYNWIFDNSGNLTAHGGTGVAYSESYDNTNYIVLYPDNWLITPAIDLSTATGTVFLEWFVALQDQGWPGERYRVLVSTTGTATSDFVEIYPEEIVQASGPDGNNYWKRTVDVSAYSGAGYTTVYFAFQHYNCSDFFYLNIDDISVYENTVIDGGLTAITAPNNDGGCTLTSAEDVTVTVFNYGGSVITDYTVSYSVDGGTPVVETVTGASIAPATSVDYTFTQTADLSGLSYYTINASFDMTNDADGTNNQASTTVTNGDGIFELQIETDDQSLQAWELVNSNGDILASGDDYMWNITVNETVCVLDNDCYIFNWNGGGSNVVTVTYNGTQVDSRTATGAYSVYAIGGNCNALDLNLQALTFAGFTMPSTNVDITGTVRNIGTDAITSFDVDYTIDGGASVGTYSVTGLSLATGDSYDFTHDVVFNETTEQVYVVEVTISNVNGGTDGNPSNNVLSSNINVNSSQLGRVVLMDHFTTEPCPNCPPVLAYLEAIYDNDPNVICMNHHAGYYTDFLTIQEHTDLLEFYNDGGSTYAPAGMYDRSYDGGDHDGDGTADPGPVFWDGDPYGGNRITEREAIPAFVSVNICGTYNTSTRVLDATIYGEFLDNFTNIGTVLWVTEDHIAQQNQQSAPAGFEHRYTSRDVISSYLGDEITTATTAGNSYEKVYPYTMDAGWDYNNLFLVGFIAHMNASDVNDREVANAIQVKLSDLQACQVGVSGIENNSIINIFPNPSTGIVNVKGAENGTIEILNSLGVVIKTINNTSNMEVINLSGFENGTYIVRVISDSNTIIKKISLVK